MIEYTDTTVFNVDTQTIVNTVNCMGVMGAGLALEFKLRFPAMYEDYVKRCKQKDVKIGKPYLYREYHSPWILNFPTKYHWRYPSKMTWIEQGLEYFVSNYKRGGITSIAFPKLGSSHGGLDWKHVKTVMEKYLRKVDIQTYICFDQEPIASGIEGMMVYMISNLDDQRWAVDLKIRSNVVDKINGALPIHRFYELSRVKGVGKQNYEKIFRFFYKKARMNEIVMTDSSHHPSNVEPTQLELIPA